MGKDLIKIAGIQLAGLKNQKERNIEDDRDGMRIWTLNIDLI